MDDRTQAAADPGRLTPVPPEPRHPAAPILTPAPNRTPALIFKPALRRLWRDPATLQLGIDELHAVVLSGLEPGDVQLLDDFDPGASPVVLTRSDGDPARSADLLAALHTAAALDDHSTIVEASRTPELEPDLLALSLRHPAPGAAAAVLAARRQTTVEVLGASRVGATIATLLAAAGLGRVTATDPAALRPADLAPGGIRRLGPGKHTRGGALSGLLASDPNFAAASGRSIAVIAPVQPVIPPEWLREVRGRPHLPILIRETVAVIGPLVIPGVTPCLRCLELARADRDPAWPVLAAQLLASRRRVAACDVALAAAAASLGALHLLSWLDDPAATASTIGGTLELSLTDLRLRRRRLHGHPGCGCGAEIPGDLG